MPSQGVQAMVEHFGDLKLDEITPAAVERYLNGLLSQGRTQSTVNRYRGILSAMFSRAKRFGLVTVNPVTGPRSTASPKAGRSIYCPRTRRKKKRRSVTRSVPTFVRCSPSVSTWAFGGPSRSPLNGGTWISSQASSVFSDPRAGILARSR